MQIIDNNKIVEKQNRKFSAISKNSKFKIELANRKFEKNKFELIKIGRPQHNKCDKLK